MWGAPSWQGGSEAAGLFMGQGVESPPPALPVSSEPPHQEFKPNSLFKTRVLLAMEEFLLKKKFLLKKGGEI